MLGAVGVATIVAAGAVTPSLAATDRDHHPTAHASRSFNAWASARQRYELNERPDGGWAEQGTLENTARPAFQAYGAGQWMGRSISRMPEFSGRGDAWGHWGAYYGPMVSTI